MTSQTLGGIVPVMLTAFTPDNKIDFDGLSNLVEWYIAKGVDTIFAVCQSSEMQYLTLNERVEIASFVSKAVAGRVPVIVSGHVSDERDEQLSELLAVADTGVDGLVLVTNRLAGPSVEGDEFIRNVDWMLAQLPEALPLGLYECPAPYRRLLSDAELLHCAQSGRFAILKDVSCDLATVTRRVGLVKDTPLSIINANAAIAYEAMQAGSRGFSGVFNNFHPDLYKWLLVEGANFPELAHELAVFLALSAMAEPMGYPKLAKHYHQSLGTIASSHSRVGNIDLAEKYWAIDALLEKISQGQQHFRAKIQALG